MLGVVPRELSVQTDEGDGENAAGEGRKDNVHFNAEDEYDC